MLDLVGIVLIMTVDPGFGGQKFLPTMLGKIRGLRQLCDARGLATVIEVDGGLSGDNAWQVIEAGATAICLPALGKIQRAPINAQGNRRVSQLGGAKE